MEWLELAVRPLGRPTQLPIRLLAPFRSPLAGAALLRVPFEHSCGGT